MEKKTHFLSKYVSRQLNFLFGNTFFKIKAVFLCKTQIHIDNKFLCQPLGQLDSYNPSTIPHLFKNLRKSVNYEK